MLKSREMQQNVVPDMALWMVLAGALVACPFLIYHFGMLGLYASVGLAGGLLGLFTHPLLLFAMYFGALFFKETRLPGVPISVNQVLAPMFFLATAVYFLRGKALSPRFSMLPLLAFVGAYFIISGLAGEDFESGLLYSRYVVVYLVLSICVAIVLTTERKIYAISWIIVLCTAVAAAHGFYEAMDKNLLNLVGHFWGANKRVSGTAANSVVFGWNMIYAFPFAFFLFSQMKSDITRFVALALGLFILAVATMTFNRQTYVIMAIVVVLCAVLYQYKNRVVLLGGLLIMSIVGAFTVMPLVLRRMLTVKNLTKDYSFLERRDSYMIGVEMFKAKPLTGIGFGSFGEVWGQYIPPDYSTYFVQYRGYNTEKYMDMGIFSIIAETGLIGIFLFTVLMAVLFVFIWRKRRAAIRAGDRFVQNYSSTLFVTLVFFLVSSFIQDTFLYTRVWILYGLIFLLDERHLPVEKPAGPVEEDDPDARLPAGLPAAT